MQLREDEDVAAEEDVTMGTALNGIKNTFRVEEIEINNRHQNESVLGNKQERNHDFKRGFLYMDP